MKHIYIYINNMNYNDIILHMLTFFFAFLRVCASWVISRFETVNHQLDRLISICGYEPQRLTRAIYIYLLTINNITSIRACVHIKNINPRSYHYMHINSFKPGYYIFFIINKIWPQYISS